MWIANFNSADETVIAGEAEAVARADAHALELGARKVSALEVGAAFHTPFMAPARDRLRKILATVAFHEAEIPIVANVDARQHTAATDWERLLSAQLMSPVRWRQSILRLGGVMERGTDAERLFVEVGPGDALSTHGAQHPAQCHDSGRLAARRPRPAGRRGLGQQCPSRLRRGPSG